MASHAIITHWDARTYTVTMGLGEDVMAPRQIGALVKAGWPEFDDSQTAAMKAWLAGRRQSLVDKALTFEQWAETVRDLELVPTVRQIEEAAMAGTINPEQAASLRERVEAVEGALGEAGAPLAP